MSEHEHGQDHEHDDEPEQHPHPAGDDAHEPEGGWGGPKWPAGDDSDRTGGCPARERGLRAGPAPAGAYHLGVSRSVPTAGPDMEAGSPEWLDLAGRIRWALVERAVRGEPMPRRGGLRLLAAGHYLVVMDGADYVTTVDRRTLGAQTRHPGDN